jgi:hypothetical protein
MVSQVMFAEIIFSFEFFRADFTAIPLSTQMNLPMLFLFFVGHKTLLANITFMLSQVAVYFQMLK